MVVKDFNPRSDERSDYELVHVDVVQRISIHAPTNGATKNIRSVFQVSSHFNPRSDERSDGGWGYYQRSSFTFQSTLRRTERRECMYEALESELISIHAPTNGATL